MHCDIAHDRCLKHDVVCLCMCLQLDNPAVLPISGRSALKAKLSCGSAQSGGVLDSWEDDLLASQPNWQESR
jgi:hypothetical protein